MKRFLFIILISAFVACQPLPTEIFFSSFDSNSQQEIQFKHIRDVEVDAMGNLYVLDGKTNSTQHVWLGNPALYKVSTEGSVEKIDFPNHQITIQSVNSLLVRSGVLYIASSGCLFSMALNTLERSPEPFYGSCLNAEESEKVLEVRRSKTLSEEDKNQFFSAYPQGSFLWSSFETMAHKNIYMQTSDLKTGSTRYLELSQALTVTEVMGDHPQKGFVSVVEGYSPFYLISNNGWEYREETEVVPGPGYVPPASRLFRRPFKKPFQGDDDYQIIYDGKETVRLLALDSENRFYFLEHDILKRGSDSGVVEEIARVENRNFVRSKVSPDNKWIYFFNDTEIYRVALPLEAQS